MVNLVRCNICHRWFSNNHGLLIHLGFCRERHVSQPEIHNHQQMEHNPLQSCYDQLDHLNPFALYDGVDQSSAEHSADEYFPDEGEEYDVHSNCMGDNTDSQSSTAITKIQVQLNDLIYRHEAPLHLFDDIVHLFNDYLSSPNFSKYAKLKTRRSFIKKNGTCSSRDHSHATSE